MKVYALVGESGTGKSYHASILAGEKGIEYIIDDGLLIAKNKVIAGISAKRVDTRLAAIRCALFMDDGHADSVKKAIKSLDPAKILILGTSVKMIERIAKVLNLGNIYEIVYIEDIASQNEIRVAKKIRREQGKHVIPVPTFEIKKDFSGYFINPLKIFQTGKDKVTKISEKTVVRPTYSYRGRYYIYDSVIESIVRYDCIKSGGISKIYDISVNSKENGIEINLDLSADYNKDLINVLKKAQVYTSNDVEKLTGYDVLKVNILVRTLILHY